MNWEVYPQGLYDLLTRITQDYGSIPLYITENGAAFPDQGGRWACAGYSSHRIPRGTLPPSGRSPLAKEVPLRGYFVWSLLDNFEWAFGYSKRFGIVYVDYQSQERIIKGSGLWYRDFIRNG